MKSCWGRWLIGIGAACAYLAFSGVFPLLPVEKRWSLDEEFSQGRTPTYPGVQARAGARSEAGLVIGHGAPGFADWTFAAPGPRPTAVRLHWIPGHDLPARIWLLVTRGGRMRSYLLSDGEVLHNRAFDLSRRTRNADAFTLRFEGREALLVRVELVESEPSPAPVGPFLIVLLCFGLWVTRTIEERMVWLVVLGAFLLRWPAMNDVWCLSLAGDPGDFRWIAHQMSWGHPFDSGAREPLYPWLLRLGASWWGDSERTVRLMSFLFSLGTVALIPAVAVSFGLSFGVGLLGAALYAGNPFAIFSSSQGYQLECFTFLILFWTWLWRKGNPLALGLGSVALCLLRLQSIFSVVPLSLGLGWRLQWSIRDWTRFLLPMVIGLTGYFTAVHDTSGSYWKHLNQHASFYWAAEKFGDPARAADLSSATVGDFLFREHSPLTLILRTVQGYATILGDPRNEYNRILLNSHYSKSWNLLLFPFFWYGLFSCARNSGGRMILLTAFFFLNILPFLKDQIREPRLLFHIAPFVSLIVATGMGGAFSALRGHFSRRETQSMS